MNSCSCLTLILACIIYWQAKQITRTMLSGDLAQEGIGATLIQHISPIEWDNVILLRPVRARSRPCPLRTGPYVVFQQQSGRYPNSEMDSSSEDTSRTHLTDSSPFSSDNASSRAREVLGVAHVTVDAAMTAAYGWDTDVLEDKTPGAEARNRNAGCCRTKTRRHSPSYNNRLD